jgi:hypothetical protein
MWLIQKMAAKAAITVRLDRHCTDEALARCRCWKA